MDHVDRLLTQTLERRRSGANQVYPQHARHKPAKATLPLPLVLPCVHRGQATDENIPCDSCGGRKTTVPVYACTKHGKCTVTREFAGTKCCRSCEDRQGPVEVVATVPAVSPREKYRWVSTANLVQATIRLAGMLPPDTSGVVGVPRSGMLPAAVLATHLHVPLYEYRKGEGVRELGCGPRGRTAYRPHNHLVVVDDTVYAGRELRDARDRLRGSNATIAAVYARPEAASSVDLYAELLPSPHILEWNLFNSEVFRGHSACPDYGTGVATDFDGIVCHDAESGGPLGTPYLVPRMHPVRLVVTGRPESDRKVTEDWMTTYGVRCECLVMAPRPGMTAAEIAGLKAAEYRKSGCGFFCESDPLQAELIFRAAGRPVVCPRAGRVFQ